MIPTKLYGFACAVLSSTIWTISKPEVGRLADARWKAEQTIAVKPVVLDGKPVPGLISDLVVSMDDRFLYFANWLQGDVRQYDISDPFKPKMTGQMYIGGLIGKAGKVHGRKLAGGPQMLQLSWTAGGFMSPIRFTAPGIISSIPRSPSKVRGSCRSMRYIAGRLERR